MLTETRILAFDAAPMSTMTAHPHQPPDYKPAALKVNRITLPGAGIYQESNAVGLLVGFRWTLCLLPLMPGRPYESFGTNSN